MPVATGVTRSMRESIDGARPAGNPQVADTPADLADPGFLGCHRIQAFYEYRAGLLQKFPRKGREDRKEGVEPVGVSRHLPNQ